MAVKSFVMTQEYLVPRRTLQSDNGVSERLRVLSLCSLSRSLRLRRAYVRVWILSSETNYSKIHERPIEFLRGSYWPNITNLVWKWQRLCRMKRPLEPQISSSRSKLCFFNFKHGNLSQKRKSNLEGRNNNLEGTGKSYIKLILDF